MSRSEKLITIAENIPKVYAAGQSSMVDESKIIEKTVSGEYISVDDVSEIPHDVKVNLTSGGKNLWGMGDKTVVGMSSYQVDLKAGITYTFSANVTSTDTDSDYCLVYDLTNDTRIDSLTRDKRSSITFTPAKDIKLMSLYASNGYANAQGDTATFKDIMLEQISGENLFDINSSEIVKDAGVAISSGGIYSSAGWNVTHYIPVEGGKHYTWYRSTEVRGIYYSWYDENKAYISGNSTTTYTLTAPENSCYFRFDYPATDTDVTFHELHEPSEYEPYKETLTDYSGVSLTRCGWNLVTFRQWTTNLSGVSMVKNDDGTIIANGKATSLRQLMSYQIPIIPNEKKISYSISDVSQSGIQGHIEFRDENNNTIQNRYFTLAETKEIPEGCTNIILNIYVIEGTTVENFVFKPMVNFGSTPLPYEPYNGQTLTANPDGTVEGITSQSPYMYMTTDNENVTINATYHKSYGMQTEYDRFWDSYQQNGQRWNYCSCFTGTAWNDETLRPKYDIKPKWDGAAGMFRLLEFNGNLKEHFASLGITCDFSEVLSASQLFYSAQYITEIPDLDMSSLNATGGTYLLYGCTNLKSAQIIFGEQATDLSSAFYGCSSLENLIIGGKIGATVDIQWSTKLTKESILSIFNALSATKSGLTLTLSTTAVTNAFGSIESTEWINLRASKSNWTISLV